MSMRLYSVILRGGSNYRPSTSLWYIPNRDPSSTILTRGQGPHMKRTTHNKYMLRASMTRVNERAVHDWLRSASCDFV